MQLNSSLPSRDKDDACKALRELDAFVPTLLLVKTLHSFPFANSYSSL